MTRILLVSALSLLLLGCGMPALLGVSTDRTLYVGGVAQPEGPPTLRHPPNSFRFAEKWRISHNWIQGTGIGPCVYGTNIFKKRKDYPALGAEPNAAMFDYDGMIYIATTFHRDPNNIVFIPKENQTNGELKNRFGRADYEPYCGHPFRDSPNGMSLKIINPNSLSTSIEFFDGSSSVHVSGNKWFVKKIEPKNLGLVLVAPLEYWTLKIPSTPYWLVLTFSGSVRSVNEFSELHEKRRRLFYSVIESVKLEPIAPLPPSAVPPFVLYQPQQRAP